MVGRLKHSVMTPLQCTFGPSSSLCAGDFAPSSVGLSTSPVLLLEQYATHVVMIVHLIVVFEDTQSRGRRRPAPLLELLLAISRVGDTKGRWHLQELDADTLGCRTGPLWLSQTFEYSEPSQFVTRAALKY